MRTINDCQLAYTVYSEMSQRDQNVAYVGVSHS